MRRIVAGIVCAALLVSASPALAQSSSAEQRKEIQRGQNMFYLGLGIAAAGLTPLLMGTPKGAVIGVPMVAGGGALAYYGRKKRRDAETRPAIQFGVAPLRKGIAIGLVRRW